MAGLAFSLSGRPAGAADRATERAAERKDGKDARSAPELQLADLAGAKHSLSDHRGKVVVLNFWATWCMPCRKEMPVLVKLQESHGKAGVQVIAAAVEEVEAAAASRSTSPRPVSTSRSGSAPRRSRWMSSACHPCSRDGPPRSQGPGRGAYRRASSRPPPSPPGGRRCSPPRRQVGPALQPAGLPARRLSAGTGERAAERRLGRARG